MSDSTVSTCPDGSECKNGSKCEEKPGDNRSTYRCNCVGDWTGVSCDENSQLQGGNGSAIDNIDESKTFCPDQDLICHNNGSCELMDDWHVCTCRSEWTGETCETKIGGDANPHDNILDQLNEDTKSTTMQQQISNNKPAVVGVSVGVTTAFCFFVVILIRNKRKKSKTASHPDEFPSGLDAPESGGKDDAGGII